MRRAESRLERLRQRHLERRTNQGIHENARPADLGPLDQSAHMEAGLDLFSERVFSLKELNEVPKPMPKASPPSIRAVRFRPSGRIDSEACPKMIMRLPQRPTCATAYPNRRKRIAPRIVLIDARKTGAVPNPCPAWEDVGVRPAAGPVCCDVNGPCSFAWPSCPAPRAVRQFPIPARKKRCWRASLRARAAAA